MLEWGILAIPWIFCCSGMYWKMSRPLIFSSPLFIRLFYIVKWSQCLKSGLLTYITNSGTCVLIILRNQLALFGNLFCNFGVINIWLFLWHIQDMLIWCTCRSPFRWWPPFRFCHPLSQKFWCTFLTLFIVMKFRQQPFERFEPTHLEMNVLTINWSFSKAIFASTSTWVLKFNWIEKTSLLLIFYFSSFDTWALTRLGNIGIEMGLFVPRSMQPFGHPLDLWLESYSLFDHFPP